MVTTATLLQACPLLVVGDLVAAVEEYTTKYGFESRMVHGEPPSYAIVSRDGQDVHLCIYPQEEARAGKASIYSYVKGADALFTDLKARGAKFIEEITDKPYGMREFCVVDSWGNLLAFGEEIDG